jgi:hypothetical protein
MTFSFDVAQANAVVDCYAGGRAGRSTPYLFRESGRRCTKSLTLWWA